MCVSLTPGVTVMFSDTILYGAEVIVNNETLHVLGYQNKAQNHAGDERARRATWWSRLFRSPSAKTTGNAMILPFPAIPGSMTKANVVDTSLCTDILRRMASAVRPRYETAVAALGAGDGAPIAPQVEVFEAAGIYTVVLAQDARDIPAALDQVPPSKRPALNPALFDAYAEWYPDWTIALCCFDNNDPKIADPLLWWYEPMFPEQLFLPTLDCHTGDVPDLDAYVKVDHVVAVGSHVLKGGKDVWYGVLPDEVAPYIRRNVIGTAFTHMKPNGDFVCQLADVNAGNFEPVRTRPGEWPRFVPA